jgi:hypothetical protein
MGLFDRLFGRQPAVAADPLLGKALDRTVEVVEPKLAFARDWRARLTPGVAAAIEFSRAAAQRLQQVHDLSPSAWATDPLVRAAFATADSVTQALGRMRDVQRYFHAPGAGDPAYAVLGMAFQTRKVLGAALVGDQVREEVERQQVSFGDYRIRIVAASIEEMQQATGVRVFNELLLAATGELAQADERRKEVNVSRAMLQARLRMLEQREGTLTEDVGGDGGEAADPLAERAELQRRLDEMNATMAQYGAGAEGLDRQLEIVRDTLLSARELVHIDTRRLHLDSMNTVLEASQAPGPAIEFEHLQAPKMSRAFVAVRIRQSDVPAGGLSIAAVERTL